MKHYCQEAIKSVSSDDEMSGGIVNLGNVSDGILDEISGSLKGSVWSPISGIERVGGSKIICQRDSSLMSSNTFYENLCEYAFRLGDKLGQERMYVDFDGQRRVFRREGNELSDIENDLRIRVLECLERGKSEWDKWHTIETVKWMNNLVDAEGGNGRLLRSIMWSHDRGYAGLFDDKEDTFENRRDVADLHMERGAEMAKSSLTEAGYPLNEIDRVAHIVSIHDKVEQLESPYEILTLEADTLGQVGITTFTGNDRIGYFKSVRKRKMPGFRSEAGRRFLDEMLAEAD